MKTVWGENLNSDNVLNEYPRPQLERDSYINLNGFWDYAITQTDECPKEFDGKILVPFSPEAELSGVGRRLMPNETLWYSTYVELADDFKKDRIILHFGAVDQCCEVYINDNLVASHIGGYTPFSVDITNYVYFNRFRLVVKVKDTTDTSYHSRGKQSLNPKGIWYTPQSGIWQSVWLESVYNTYIKNIRITPLYDASCVEMFVEATYNEECELTLLDKTYRFQTNTAHKIEMESFEDWSPENPYLYYFTVKLGKDCVKSYFAMRKIEVKKDENGTARLFLNNKSYFHNGLLDQGYWPDGLYTAPSDEALIYDIQTAKNMGFNMLRKHIKIEPMRWYYHCDRLGMMVWQDMINGGGKYNTFTISAPLVTDIHLSDDKYKLFARSDENGRKQYMAELGEMLDALYNVPSVVVWVPFNEGWGQFDATNVYDFIRQKDKTRVIDHASGWHDQYIGEVKSKHVYFVKYRHKQDKLGRAVVLSEFGGYGLKIEGHTFNDINFCYRKFNTKEAFAKAYRELFEKEIIPSIEKGLSATVYTQLSDVETELNGLISYDRKIVKINISELSELNKKITL